MSDCSVFVIKLMQPYWRKCCMTVLSCLACLILMNAFLFLCVLISMFMSLLLVRVPIRTVNVSHFCIPYISPLWNCDFCVIHVTVCEFVSPSVYCCFYIYFDVKQESGVTHIHMCAIFLFIWIWWILFNVWIPHVKSLYCTCLYCTFFVLHTFCIFCDMLMWPVVIFTKFCSYGLNNNVFVDIRGG